MSSEVEPGRTLEIVPDRRRVFLWSGGVYGAGMLVFTLVMSLLDGGWELDRPPVFPFLVAPVSGGLFGWIMMQVASAGWFSLGPEGLTRHTRKASVTIPAGALESIGVTGGRIRRFLVVRFDPEGLPENRRPLREFLRMGRRVTKADGSLAVLATFFTPGPDEIRRYVEATGLAGWRQDTR